MSFRKDLAAAKVFEQLTADNLQRLYPEALVETIDGKPTELDPHPADVIFHQGKSLYTIEVKHDQMSAKTGNICIEEATLLKSKADYLIYYADCNDGELFLIPTKGLLEKLQTTKEVRRIGNAGDARKYGWKKQHTIYLVSRKSTFFNTLLSNNSPFDNEWLQQYKNLLGK
jgi:hypothetical protein